MKETANAKSECVSLKWTPSSYQRFVLFEMRPVNTLMIVMYGVMDYLLLMPKLVAFYAKLNEK